MIERGRREILAGGISSRRSAFILAARYRRRALSASATHCAVPRRVYAWEVILPSDTRTPGNPIVVEPFHSNGYFLDVLGIAE